jgi:hypothetical protein
VAGTILYPFRCRPWQVRPIPSRCLLDLETAEHEYAAPGKHEVLVKVVEIFGNDASQLLTWEAR